MQYMLNKDGTICKYAKIQYEKEIVIYPCMHSSQIHTHEFNLIIENLIQAQFALFKEYNILNQFEKLNKFQLAIK